MRLQNLIPQNHFSQKMEISFLANQLINHPISLKQPFSLSYPLGNQMTDLKKKLTLLRIKSFKHLPTKRQQQETKIHQHKISLPNLKS